MHLTEDKLIQTELNNMPINVYIPQLAENITHALDAIDAYKWLKFSEPFADTSL